MTLLQSWADSLTLLKPKNLQLFVMVTIKSILEAYKLYFKYFWWLMLILPLFFFMAPDYVVALSDIVLVDYDVFPTAPQAHLFAKYLILLGIASSFYGLLFLAACFITRPSILQKDWSYFLTQFKKIIVYWFVSGVFWKAVFISFSVSSRCIELIFFVLFFADSDGGLKNIFRSLWNTLKMIIYNLPLLCVIAFCFSLVTVLFNHCMYISPFVNMMISALLMPIGVCTYANIYIKKLHDQFDLYFKQPE